MILILTCLVLTTALVLAVLLAVLVVGIRSDERAVDLTGRPHTPSAAVARRLLGLHARKPVAPACLHAAASPGHQPPPIPGRRESPNRS